MIYAIIAFFLAFLFILMTVALKAMGGDVDWDRIENSNFDKTLFAKWNKENAE